MKIYQVYCHGDKFQTLNFVEWPSDQEYRRFNCIPKENWENNLMYIASPQKRRGNFFATSLDVLISDERAFEVFQYYFQKSCQVLPVMLERSEEKLYLYNVLECCNALDYDNTIWRYYEDGTKGSIKEPHFLKKRIGSPSTLFKIPEFNGMKVFTFTDPSMDPEETFKGIYEKHGLTGLDFYLTWSDENDGEEIKLMFF